MVNSKVARITPQAKFCVVALSPYISRENYVCVQLIATADMACLSLYHDEVNGSFNGLFMCSYFRCFESKVVCIDCTTICFCDS